MNPNNQPHTIEIPGAALMIKGLAADLHAKRHSIKQAKYPFDAGLDLFASHAPPEVVKLEQATLLLVNTFVHICCPPGTMGMVVERSSSLNRLQGARVKAAYIDAGYTGEILVCVVSNPEAADRTLEIIKQIATEEVAIAQFIVLPVMMPILATWNDANVPKGRGSNGFGHTDLFMR